MQGQADGASPNRRDDSRSRFRTKFWRVPQGQRGRKLLVSPAGKHKAALRELAPFRPSKKANFLSGIEQIDALNRDRL